MNTPRDVDHYSAETSATHEEKTMAIERGQRFPIKFEDAFSEGLFLMGEITEDRIFVNGKNADGSRIVGPQKVDEATGLLQWKGIVTDPGEAKAKNTSFDLVFLAAVRPVPSTPEIAKGLRPIELEGVEVEPRVMGQGEFKFQGYRFFARGFVGDTSGARGNAAPAAGGSKASAAKGGA